MSLATMIAEMRGCVPGYSAILARTHIRNAWTDIRNMGGWSFQLCNGGFGTPGLINQGSVVVNYGSTTVVGDIPASIAWSTLGSDPGSLLTQRQFRVGQGTIYNIIGYAGNGGVYAAAVATIGMGQTPGTYTVPILDTGPGSGATCSVIVTSGGYVAENPIILTQGSNYTAPYVGDFAGGTPATFAFSLFGQLTLDRPFYDTTASDSIGYGQGGFGGGGFGGQENPLGYSIYQCYYPVPVKDFQAWESTVDINNAIDLCCGNAKKYRDFADQFDPQRQIFANPGTWIPYQADSRPGSSTFGWMMYELYPQPQSTYAYATWYTRLGADLVLPSDTLPFQITEHVVKTMARVKAYEWLIAKLAAEGKNTSGVQFTMQAAAKEATGQLKELRSLDRDRVDMWYSVMTRVQGYGYATTFNPSTGFVTSTNT